jgi:hypothetical protein
MEIASLWRIQKINTGGTLKETKKSDGIKLAGKRWKRHSSEPSIKTEKHPAHPSREELV